MADHAGTTFGARLVELAATDGDRAALTFESVTLSRSELVDSVARLVARFAALGVGVGATVTIGLANSVELVQAIFAAWWVGATPHVLSPRLAAPERAAIIELAEPALVVGLTGDEVGARPTLDVDELRVATATALTGASAPGPDAVAPVWKIMGSGGSTGRPKLVVTPQPAIFEDIAALASVLRFPDERAVLVTGPMSHNSPFVITTICLLLGCHVVLMPRFDAVETLRLVERHRIAWIYLVPTMMQRIWRLPAQERERYDMSSVDVAFHMAAPCPPWLKEAWIGWLGGEHVYELYGGTELQAMTVLDGEEWLAHRGSVGRTVIGEIEIRDDDGRALEPDEVGRIWMRRGPGAPSPYRYIGATARGAAEGWETLGDIGLLRCRRVRLRHRP